MALSVVDQDAFAGAADARAREAGRAQHAQGPAHRHRGKAGRTGIEAAGVLAANGVSAAKPNPRAVLFGKDAPTGATGSDRCEIWGGGSGPIGSLEAGVRGCENRIPRRGNAMAAVDLLRALELGENERFAIVPAEMQA